MTGSDSYRLGERARAARWVVAGAFLVLLGAFFRTQIIQHEKFQLKAETNRLRPIALTAPRGTIYDRHGQIIAENVPGYSVKLLAPSADSLLAVLARVGEVVPLDSTAIVEVLRRFQTARYQPVVVFGDATFETVSKLEEHRVAFPASSFRPNPSGCTRRERLSPTWSGM